MITEKTEKAVVTTEVRPPIIEKNVMAPEVKREGFLEYQGSSEMRRAELSSRRVRLQ